MPAAGSVAWATALCATAVLALGTACGAGSELRGAMAETAAADPAPVVTGAPAGAVPSGTAQDSTVPGDGPADPCTGPVLSVSLGAPRISGDTVDQDLIFQNTGPGPCVMRGFPSVVAVAGNEGVPVGDPAPAVGERGGPVRLEPRAAATVPLHVVRPSAYDDAVCLPRDVRGLRVVPAGGSGPVFVPRDGTACSGGPLDPPPMTVGTAVAR